MDRITALIVDDEPRARRGIRTLLARDPEVEVVAECPNAAKAIAAIERFAPNLVFLDIQMPDGTGFDVLERIELETPPTLIFITAYDAFALKAFEVHALDYLLKPFTDERFFQALERAKAQHRSGRAGKFGERLMSLLEHYGPADSRKRPQSAPKAAELPLRRFFIKSGGDVHFVPIDEVDWIEAVGYYVRLHTAGKTHLLRGNLGSIEARLPKEKFVRVHRSAMVNLDRVRSLKRWFHGDCLAVLRDGAEVKVSRSRRKKLEALLAHAE